jgi:hypothetical protein
MRSAGIRVADPPETKPDFQNSDNSFYTDIHRSALFFSSLKKAFIDKFDQFVKIKPHAIPPGSSRDDVPGPPLLFLSLKPAVFMVIS